MPAHALPRRLALLACVAFCATAAGALPALAATLVRDGKPVARIYVSAPLPDVPAAGAKKNARGLPAPKASANAPATPAPGAPAAPGAPPDPRLADLAIAVDDFNDHIELMSGARLEVVVAPDASAIQGPAVLLGDLASKAGAALTRTSESQEGFRILAKGDRLLVHGQSPAAIAFGLYEVLRRLGCDWVMPGDIGQIVPRKPTIEFPDLDLASAPDFLVRRLWYRGYRTNEHPAKPEEGARFAQWLRRHKAGAYSHIASQTGGHVWDQFIRRHQAEFDRDPTMLALRPDRTGQLKRMGPQLESTHPRVVELFVEEIKAAYAKNIADGKWTRDTAAGFGIGPADGLGYSRSDEAKKASPNRIDPIVGEEDQTDLLVLLGNRILEQVHKEYPNAHVGFYSYSTHADYPSRYTPNPKMGVIFAPINFSRYHSVVDPLSRTQAWYRDVVEKWGALSKKQGNPLLYRGYNWNLAENLLPYTKVQIWGEELPFYKKHGFVGLNVEATKMWSILGPSDYIFMRLSWDASLDWQALLKEYCEKTYGKAAPQLLRYHLLLVQRQREAKQEAGSYHAIHLIYDDAFVAQARQLLDQGLAAAHTDADRTRVGHVIAGVEALRLYLAYHAATLRFDFPAAKAGLDAMAAHWQKTYDANSDLVANEAPHYLKRFIQTFVDQSLTYSSEPYRIVHRIPDSLPTRFDPDRQGEAQKLDLPGTPDADWTPTHTYSTNWDAQGFGHHRRGAVWYRHRFTLPADAASQPLGLFVGGVEDEVRVWLNGQTIGGSGVRFSSPAAFDLSQAYKPSQENLLVLQVIRNSNANELGLGGILRPCFLFAGPRLEKKSPATLPARRILPGGELGGFED